MFIMVKKIILFALVLSVSACTEIEPKPFEPSTGHISPEQTPAADADIPKLVEQVPVLPEPGEPKKLERYTVVVNEVPVKELLFALARDAKINVDIHPDINGVVTINAVEQTLPQILKRISNQVDMRYEYNGNDLVILPDTPFLRSYKVDYVNLSRDTSSSSTVSTQISSTSGGTTSSSGGGGNNSTTDVTTESVHHFWARLVSNISALLGEESPSASGKEIKGTENVIPNPESGILTVRATAAQHKQIQSLIDRVLVSAKRQVLVQTTIVEVTLNKKYQAGIDWSVLNLNGQSGINLVSTTLAGAPVAGALSSFVIQAVDNNPTRKESLTAKVSLLDEFGDTKILSSPQIMVLNNQTALLKVVENIVYFEIGTDTTSTQGVVTTTVDTTAKTVPVGIVMAVTPQIDSDGTITLNVRPTISRKTADVADPNPNIPAGTQNLVPQIAVREMESVLKMTDGQIGVLGGLMTDDNKDNDAGIPGIKDAGFFGNLFKSKSAQYSKTELVIFIKPIIINNPSLENDLEEYKKYLTKEYNPSDNPVKAGEGNL